MYRFSWLLLSFLLVFSSCNNEDDQVQDEQTADSGFFALKVGNKWAYNFFRVNSQTGELTNLDALEEVEITQEEVIGQETFFTMKITTSDPNNVCAVCNEETTIIKQVKDSLGYLVEVSGPILFSSESNVDYLIRTEEWGSIYRVLLPNEVLVDVPAGQFVSKDNQRYAIFPDGERSNGEDNLYFAEGIGEIKQTFSGVNSNRILYEKQLVSYSVE
ncbi:MAG: hypothetical protein AAF466_03635 [Bacteroidota bacterium]